MSGYPPYGYPGGGYPPSNPMDYSGFQNYSMNNNFQPPPPVPMYDNNQSFSAPYGQPPDNSYGYQPPMAQMPTPMFNQPPQQYGGYNNMQYQPPYPQGNPSGFAGNLYPSVPTTTATPPSYNSGAPTQFQNQPYYPEEQQSVILASLENYQGTIFPAGNFNPDADCETLRKAMHGAGTDERALVDIIANRSNAQRQQIKRQYKTMYGMDLIKQIAGETSGHFKETITALFQTPADYDAWSLKQAINGSKEGTLAEILLTRTNNEIRAIVEAYRRTFNRDLENDISKRVGGTDFKRLLVSAVQANRDELSPQQIQQARQMGIESVIDRNRALQDAEALYKAGAGKLGTDEKTFNAIFSQRNYYQLRATFEEYQKKYRNDMTKVINSEFSGDIKKAYLTLISCIRDRPTFFAERIRKAVVGLGTNDSTLIRVIVTRSEIDLVQIKQRYQQMFSRTLAQDVSGDTSGDYKRILLAIVK